MSSTVARRVFAVRWAVFEPIQGGCVMPIRIRCRNQWPHGPQLIEIAPTLVYFQENRWCIIRTGKWRSASYADPSNHC